MKKAIITLASVATLVGSLNAQSLNGAWLADNFGLVAGDSVNGTYDLGTLDASLAGCTVTISGDGVMHTTLGRSINLNTNNPLVLPGSVTFSFNGLFDFDGDFGTSYNAGEINTISSNGTLTQSVIAANSAITVLGTSSGGTVSNTDLSSSVAGGHTGDWMMSNVSQVTFTLDSHPGSAGTAGTNIVLKNFTKVPEPSSTVLLGLGGLALFARRKRA